MSEFWRHGNRSRRLHGFIMGSIVGLFVGSVASVFVGRCGTIVGTLLCSLTDGVFLGVFFGAIVGTFIGYKPSIDFIHDEADWKTPAVLDGGTISMIVSVLIFLYYFLGQPFRPVEILRVSPEGVFWMLALVLSLIFGTLTGQFISGLIGEFVWSSVVYDITFGVENVPQNKLQAIFTGSVAGSVVGFVCMSYLVILTDLLLYSMCFFKFYSVCMGYSVLITDLHVLFGFYEKGLADILLVWILGSLGVPVGLVIGAIAGILLPPRRVTGLYIGIAIGALMGIIGLLFTNNLELFTIKFVFSFAPLFFCLVLGSMVGNFINKKIIIKSIDTLRNADKNLHKSKEFTLYSENRGSIISAIIRMLILSVLIGWIPLIGPLIAGYIGGKKARSVSNAIIAVALPVLILTILIYTVFLSLSLVIAYDSILLIGAVIGGASA